MHSGLDLGELASLLTPNDTSLKYLSSFNKILIDEVEFWQATQFFLNGGWPEIIKQYFYASPDSAPVIIFPGEELGAKRIDPVPTVYKTGMTIGQMVIQTAWIRGFSPRLIDFYPNGEQDSQVTVLKFVRKSGPLPIKTKCSPCIEALDKTLLPKGEEIPTLDTLSDHGKKLIDLITGKLISAEKPFEYFGKSGPGNRGKIQIHPDLKGQYVRMNLNSRALAEILDAFCYCLDAVWEWIDETTIYIGPRSGCGRASPDFWPKDESGG